MTELGEFRGKANGWVIWWVLKGIAPSVLDKTSGMRATLQVVREHIPAWLRMLTCLIKGIEIGRNLGSKWQSTAEVLTSGTLLQGRLT